MQNEVRSKNNENITNLRAAQYLRMSTDLQQYSPQNQAVVIAAYAARHNLTIVRTYIDEGRSGLRISNRQALTDLMDDVCSRNAQFDYLLVYDVSRWGRFQDIDESAHYEFLCRQAGVTVAYCAEQFPNDQSLMSGILKNLKRVMAAEYSRELSVRVHAGASRMASMGFRSGATPGYGLRRELVDENRNHKALLEKGQRKHLATDHVVLRPGPAHELEIVKRIFREFVDERKSQLAIMRELNSEGVPTHREKPWTEWMVHYLLQNENYIGNIVYNRKSFRLRQVMRANPSALWIRKSGALQPIIDTDIFLKAQRIIKEHYVRRSDKQLLQLLKETLNEKGKLSAAILNKTDGMASPALYALRFGSLRKAFRLVGYRPTRNYGHIDSRVQVAERLEQKALEIARRIRALGAAAAFDANTDTMVVDNRVTVSFRAARYYHQPKKPVLWNINRRTRLPFGLILALRLDKKNKNVLDYFLMPTTEMKNRRIALTSTSRSRFASYRIATVAKVVLTIMERVASSNVSPLAEKKTRRGL